MVSARPGGSPTLMTRLRFAVVYEEGTLERWHLDCLDRLENVAELAAVIVTPLPATPPQRPAASGRHAPVRAPEWKHAHVRHTAERFADVRRIHAGRETPVDLSGLDFVLKFGRGPVLIGLAHARYGLWYFEHETRGGLPPFLRQVYEAPDVTCAALARSCPDTGDSQRSSTKAVSRPEKLSYAANHALVVAAAAAWPARICERG